MADTSQLISGVAERYASSLFELALEQGAIDAVSADLGRFDVSDFAKDLIEDLVGALKRDDIRVTTDLAPVFVPSVKASPLALIVNGRAMHGQTVHCVQGDDLKPMQVVDPVFIDKEGKRRDGID